MVVSLNILVSGCSIAGPAAAYWLNQAGHTVTVVERSIELRRAGQNVDVRGTGREVLRRMGLEDEVLAHNTGEVGTRFVGERGESLFEMPAGTSDSDGSTAEAEILRGELSRLLMEALPADVTVRFGESIAAVDQSDGGVTVNFRGGSCERFDLVVVAEGTRSSTRAMVFGEVPVTSIGLYTAFGTIARGADDDLWWNWYSGTGGRSVTIRPDNQGTTRVALSFLSPPAGYEDLAMDDQKSVVVDRFRDLGWKVPRVLDGLRTTTELYVDYLTQVAAPAYGNGRVVLLGDAAWCATPLSGLGTTLALTGAYVLAGELSCGTSVDEAVREYQRKMKTFVDPAQKLPPGAPRLVHPKTRLGLAMLRGCLRLAGSPPVRAVASRLPSRASEVHELPGYPALRS